MSIVITGANGEFGRAVLNAVAALRPGERIVASVRDVARAADIEARGFDVRPGSFDGQFCASATDWPMPSPVT